jgi:hypothetical protein
LCNFHCVSAIFIGIPLPASLALFTVQPHAA